MKKAIVIGAGINGLVAANYLRRGGCEVTLLEKKPKVGGACTFEWTEFAGKKYPVPTGASVFGMMQDFVFDDTGLGKKIEYWRSSHPKMVYFGDEAEPLYQYDDWEKYQAEAKKKWGENGDLVAFNEDLEKVRQFLLGLYVNATSPTLERAEKALGPELTARWIRGSAKALFDHYFTGDRTKIYEAMPVTESGPVGLDDPYTAFTVAVMSAGSVLDGYWGFVKGALWRVPLALDEINRELGVETILSTDVHEVREGQVTFTHGGKKETRAADAIFLATDPVTAANLVQDAALKATVSGKKLLGSSGKVVLVFKDAVKWKGDTGHPEFDATVRYFYEPQTWEAFEKSNAAARAKTTDFSPCSFQVYVEGGAMRKMGWDEPFDYLSVFCKDFALTKRGVELPEVKEAITRRILSRISNPEAFLGSVLYTPKDLQETFFFPEGNIDHIEVTGGQTYLTRTFSPVPEEQFYQFGAHPGVFYCGAGAFPCGSVAGTPGSMAAKQWMRRNL